jgi:hypothetical protein
MYMEEEYIQWHEERGAAGDRSGIEKLAGVGNGMMVFLLYSPLQKLQQFGRREKNRYKYRITHTSNSRERLFTVFSPSYSNL